MNLQLFKVTRNPDAEGREGAQFLDEFDSFVCASFSGLTARHLSPCEWGDYSDQPDGLWEKDSWTTQPKTLAVECLGTATKGAKPGIILASYRRG